MTSIITTTKELSQSEMLGKSLGDLDLNNLDMPYVVKDKILMSPGTWNGYFYSIHGGKPRLSFTGASLSF